MVFGVGGTASSVTSYCCVDNCIRRAICVFVLVTLQAELGLFMVLVALQAGLGSLIAVSSIVGWVGSVSGVGSTTNSARTWFWCW